jgi:hypothetical protein
MKQNNKFDQVLVEIRQNVTTSGILLLLNVLHQFRVHSGDIEEESLNGRIVIDAPTTTGI